MKAISAIFLFEFKRAVAKRSILLLLLPIVFSLIFIQIGVAHYKDALASKQTFQEIERSKMSQYISYSQYSSYGFRILFVPSPYSIFAINSGVTNDMVSQVDTTERLKVDNPLIGKNLFNLRKTGFNNFSGIILFFGSLLSILYGYLIISNIEYSKFHACIYGSKRYILPVIFARIFLLALLLLSLFTLCLITIALNGIPAPINSHLFTFYLITLILNIFFFLMGTIFSSSKSRIGSTIASFITWFLFIFIVPALIESYIAGKANFITATYKIEIEKFKIITNFEKKAVKEHGKYYQNSGRNSAQEQAIVEGYLNTTHKHIEKLEDHLMNETIRVIDNHATLSAFFPSAFYLSFVNEYGSWGYENYLSFFDYIRKTKNDLLKFYIRKQFYTNETTIEPFVKHDENIYHGQSRLPRHFALGSILSVLYLLALLHISYYRFKKSLFPAPDHDKSDLNNAVIRLNSGESKVYLVEDYRFRNQFYSLLSRECGEFASKGYQDKIFINGRDLVAHPEKSHFLYVCPPHALPTDVAANDFIRFVASCAGRSFQDIKKLIAQLPADIAHKRIGHLDKQSKGEILLTLLDITPYQIYLIEDVGRGMPIDFNIRLKIKMDQLKSQGALVIYLTTDDLLLVKHVKRNQSFYETHTWNELVDRYNGIKP